MLKQLPADEYPPDRASDQHVLQPGYGYGYGYGNAYEYEYEYEYEFGLELIPDGLERAAVRLDGQVSVISVRGMSPTATQRRGVSREPVIPGARQDSHVRTGRRQRLLAGSSTDESGKWSGRRQRDRRSATKPAGGPRD